MLIIIHIESDIVEGENLWNNSVIRLIFKLLFQTDQ